LKPIAALIALGLVGTCFAGPAVAAASPAKPPTQVSYAAGVTLYDYTLPNGLRVLLLPLKNSPVTTMHTWVGSGSRDEKPGITGIAHLFEHMMFRPTHDGAKSYYDQASALGLDYNATTRFNATDYYDTFTPELLPQVVALEANRFKHLRVTPEMLKVEREAVRSEYSTKFDANPMIDLWFWIYRHAFPNHPYGWHIVGYREDLDRITAEDCNRFFSQHYVPNNAMIALAGSFDRNQAMSLITQHFGDWKRGPAKPAWTRPVPQGQAPLQAAGKLEAPSKYMLMGWRVPERTAPGRLAHDLAEFILFNGKDALVPRRLMDQAQIASMADAFNTGYDIGLSKLLVLPNAGVAPSKVHQEVQAAIDGFAKLSEPDFVAYRQAFATQFRESQLKTHGITGALGHAWAYDGDFRFAITDPAAVLKLPRKDVAAAINRTYRTNNRVTVITP
jgi:predicted Zn-dependent peptidase